MDKSRLNLTLNNLANFIRAQSINSIEMISPKDEDLSGIKYIIIFIIS